MWIYSEISDEEAKLHALWFDPSLGLLQMLLTRVPGHGGWTEYRKYTQARFYTLDAPTH